MPDDLLRALVDTNIFLRHLLQDHADHSRRATACPGADVYHAILLDQLKLSEIVTFDQDFDRVQGLRRLEP